ncbi:MAG: Bacterial transcriptional regulator [Bacteroidetes bacterium]|nr:Bacterial transcriptional regulator [Bacteroidota bacterium]
MARLKDRLKEIRRTGFTIADAEYKPDLCVIAVPIRDHHGKIQAALMTALQSERMRRNRALSGEIVEALQSESAVISRELGYQGQPS